MKQALFWILALTATAFAANDDQLIQQALKNSAVMQAGKLDTTRFTRYSSSTQLKLNGKVPVTRTVNGQPLTGNVTITNISGNAGTATALAANGTNCGAGQAPLGMDASGNAEGCFTPTGTYALPQASTSVLGGVKPDGTTITSAAGIISVVNPLNQNTTGSAAKLTTARTINGVSFDGTGNIQTATSDTSDYAIGTWTPGVSFGGSSASVTYSLQVGRYLKVGRLVWVEGVVVLTNNGSGTGTARITGLPSTVTNEAASNGASLTVGYAIGSGILGLTGSFEPNGTTIVLYVPGATTSVAATDSNITNTSQIYFSGFYLGP